MAQRVDGVLQVLDKSRPKDYAIVTYSAAALFDCTMSAALPVLDDTLTKVADGLIALVAPEWIEIRVLQNNAGAYAFLRLDSAPPGLEVATAEVLFVVKNATHYIVALRNRRSHDGRGGDTTEDDEVFLAAWTLQGGCPLLFHRLPLAPLTARPSLAARVRVARYAAPRFLGVVADDATAVQCVFLRQVTLESTTEAGTTTTQAGTVLAAVRCDPAGAVGVYQQLLAASPQGQARYRVRFVSHRWWRGLFHGISPLLLMDKAAAPDDDGRPRVWLLSAALARPMALWRGLPFFLGLVRALHQRIKCAPLVRQTLELVFCGPEQALLRRWGGEPLMQLPSFQALALQSTFNDHAHVVAAVEGLVQEPILVRGGDLPASTAGLVLLDAVERVAADSTVLQRTAAPLLETLVQSSAQPHAALLAWLGQVVTAGSPLHLRPRVFQGVLALLAAWARAGCAPLVALGAAPLLRDLCEQARTVLAAPPPRGPEAATNAQPDRDRALGFLLALASGLRTGPAAAAAPELADFLEGVLGPAVLEALRAHLALPWGTPALARLTPALALAAATSCLDNAWSTPEDQVAVVLPQLFFRMVEQLLTQDQGQDQEGRPLSPGDVEALGRHLFQLGYVAEAHRRLACCAPVSLGTVEYARVVRTVLRLLTAGAAPAPAAPPIRTALLAPRLVHVVLHVLQEAVQQLRLGSIGRTRTGALEAGAALEAALAAALDYFRVYLELTSDLSFQGLAATQGEVHERGGFLEVVAEAAALQRPAASAALAGFLVETARHCGSLDACVKWLQTRAPRCHYDALQGALGALVMCRGWVARTTSLAELDAALSALLQLVKAAVRLGDDNNTSSSVCAEAVALLHDLVNGPGGGGAHGERVGPRLQRVLIDGGGLEAFLEALTRCYQAAPHRPPVVAAGQFLGALLQRRGADDRAAWPVLLADIDARYQAGTVRRAALLHWLSGAAAQEGLQAALRQTRLHATQVHVILRLCYLTTRGLQINGRVKGLRAALRQGQAPEVPWCLRQDAWTALEPLGRRHKLTTGEDFKFLQAFKFL